MDGVSDTHCQASLVEGEGSEPAKLLEAQEVEQARARVHVGKQCSRNVVPWVHPLQGYE